MPLDELIRDYESGSRLLGICRNRSAKARERVEIISNSLAAGEIRLEEFEDDAAAPSQDSEGADSGGAERDEIQLL